MVDREPGQKMESLAMDQRYNLFVYSIHKWYQEHFKHAMRGNGGQLFTSGFFAIEENVTDSCAFPVNDRLVSSTQTTYSNTISTRILGPSTSTFPRCSSTITFTDTP